MNDFTATTTATIDSAKAEAFSGEMLAVLNHGFLALLTSVGHRTRLFETMAALPPATSADIANVAGLHERYVREWLGGMVSLAASSNTRRRRKPTGSHRSMLPA